MASRRNATPLFDLVGPLAPGTVSKPRFRSPVPPPAPTAQPTSSATSQARHQVPDPPPDTDDGEHEASTAVAEPRRKPIEVHTAESPSDVSNRAASESPASATAQSKPPVAPDEPSPIRVIKTKSAPHGNPAPPLAQTEPTLPDPRPIDSHHETDSLGTARGFADLKQTLLTGTNRIYFASGVVIIGLVIVWFVANALLSSGAGTDIDTSASLQTHAEGGIVDPLGDGTESSADTTGGRRVPTIEMGAVTAGSVGKSEPQPTPTPGLTVDPRVPGQNYLHLAGRLSWDEAARAAAFLTARGQPAIAVGMDSGTLQGNNTEKFWLISLYDVPEGRFIATEGRRDAHVERIAALGEIWARDHGGTVSFHDPYWDKYDP